MLPRFRTAFDTLTAWVEGRQESPVSRTVPRLTGNGATDPELLNPCSTYPGAGSRDGGPLSARRAR